MGTTALASLIALLVPLIVAVVSNANTSGAVKGALATAFSVAIGALTVYGSGNATVEQYAQIIVTVIVAAQASYGMFWKPLGVTSWILENIGNKG